ncbi:Transcriptional regulator [Shigella boydii]
MTKPYVRLDKNDTAWICPYISRHLLSLNPLQARCRRYSRGER